MKRSFGVLILVLATPLEAFAWGGDGHQIISLIAEKRLTPEAITGIDELLVDAEISDAEIVDWADVIRRRERRYTQPWHFVNIPVTAEGYDAERDGKDGDNVIARIEAFEKVLADRAAPKEERVEALKFLVHFVGDLHQPLHCAERNKDKGGNKRLVFFMNRSKAVNLHECWDSLILLQRKKKVRVADYADTLNAKITDEQAKAWGSGTVVDWANESHKAAVEHVYADVAADGPPPRLRTEYVEKSGMVIDEQLQKAGIRVAIVLNRAFTKQPVEQK